MEKQQSRVKQNQMKVCNNKFFNYSQRIFKSRATT